jgi:hypothetical protein
MSSGGSRGPPPCRKSSARQELLEQIAGLMGLSGAGHGYEGAAAEPGAHEIAHR